MHLRIQSWMQTSLLHRLCDEDLMSSQGQVSASCHYMILTVIHLHIIFFTHTHTQPFHFYSILCDRLKFIAYY